MFKKLAEETVDGCDATPLNPQDTTNRLRQQLLLDFIFQHAKYDERPFLEISICGFKIKGLLDSGASRTVLGNEGWELIKGSGVGLNSKSTFCTMANGAKTMCLGSIYVPIQLAHTVMLFEILVVPEVPHLCILGVDFWKDGNNSCLKEQCLAFF